jgi:rod shape-determining protein MreD
MLLGDLLFHRPPGLLALLVVIGNEYMRRQSGHSRDMSFMGEWVTAAATITVITIANRLVLGATGVQQAALGLILIQMIMTVFAYPLVALVSQNLLGVRRLAPSDLDAMGVPR